MVQICSRHVPESGSDKPSYSTERSGVLSPTMIDSGLAQRIFDGLPREQTVLKGHLPRVIYHQVVAEKKGICVAGTFRQAGKLGRFTHLKLGRLCKHKLQTTTFGEKGRNVSFVLLALVKLTNTQPFVRL